MKAEQLTKLYRDHIDYDNQDENMQHMYDLNIKALVKKAEHAGYLNNNGTCENCKHHDECNQTILTQHIDTGDYKGLIELEYCSAWQGKE